MQGSQSSMSLYESIGLSISCLERKRNTYFRRKKAQWLVQETTASSTTMGIASFLKPVDKITDTCLYLKCKQENCLKRHPRLCKDFSKFGSCRFDSSCSFLHKPSEFELIFEEMRLLQTEVKGLTAQNEFLQKILQKFDSFENDINIMKNAIQDISNKLDEKTVEPPKTDTEKLLETHPCDTCDFTSKSKTGLKNHIRAKHPKSSNPIQDKSDGHLPQQPFNCGNCEFNFRSHDSLELLDHCRDVHGWFLCRNWLGGDGCEHEAANAEDLETHMKNSCEYNQH